jgi:hypothetical protein
MSSSKTTKTPEELDEELIRELEQQIEEVVELMASRKNKDTSAQEVLETDDLREKHINNGLSVFMEHKKHKSIVVTKHCHFNFKHIEALKQDLKFRKYPRNLQRHLQTLSDRLLVVMKRKDKRNRK